MTQKNYIGEQGAKRIIDLVKDRTSTATSTTAGVVKLDRDGVDTAASVEYVDSKVDSGGGGSVELATAETAGIVYLDAPPYLDENEEVENPNHTKSAVTLGGLFMQDGLWNQIVNPRISSHLSDKIQYLEFDANPAKMIAVIPSGGSTASFIRGTVILELE